MKRLIVTAWFMLSLASGCGFMMVGEPVREQDLSSVDDAEENLKAIRAMRADQAAHRLEEKRSDRPIEPSPADVAPSLPESSSGLRPAPSSSSPTARANVPAKLPWTPTALDRPPAQDRPVPAYITPAPVGPDSSGSVRCVPDGLGGQRCLGR